MVGALLALLLAVDVKAQQGAIAFTHVNVVPMDRERVSRDQTVVVHGGRITAIGRSIALLAGTRVIDGTGQWLSPGLADMHVHSDTREELAVYLANGITTVLNMGDARPGFVARTTTLVNAGRLAGPHVYNAFIVDGSPAYGHFAVTSPAEATAIVGLARSNGYRFIKVYNNLDPRVFAALAAEGRRLGMPLVGHGVTNVGLRQQAAAGQVLVGHAEEFFYTFFATPGETQTDAPPGRARIREAVDFAKRHGLAVGADLVTYHSIMRQIGHPELIDTFLAQPAAAYVSPADRLAWRRSGYVGKTADLRERYAFLEAMLKVMADNGVELLAGTDAPTIPGVPAGYSLHDNLALLETAGLSRFQVLATATRDPGRFMSRVLGEAPTGTITVGACADLILTARSPLADLSELRRATGVMRAGRWYDRKELDDLLAEVVRDYGR